MGEIVKSEIFLQLDVLDQQQIVAAATGEVIDELVYKVKGKTAISWAGINHICFFMGDIEVNEPKETQWERITMFGDRVYWAATIRARNTKYGLSSLGTAEAPELADTHVVDDNGRWVKNPDGSWEMTLREDPHCRRKALSMAQRNGKRAVMPAVVLKKWLDYFLKLKKGETVDPPFQSKYVDSTQKIVEETPEKKEKKKKPEKKVEKPKPEEEPPKGPPESVKDVTERLSKHIVGLDEWIVVSEYQAYYRVGKRKQVEEEMEYTVDELVKRMGGKWDKDSNCWKIPKEAEGR